MAQRLSQDVLKKFRLTRDPFVNELRSGDDVFMSRAHKRASWLLADAAAHQYFIALVGAVGSGKTVVLKRVLESLDREGSYEVSRLRCVEKEQVNAYSIMEALVRDFSSEPPRRSREARARQIGAMLTSMIADRRRPVLVIDEAHALNYRTLRALKRLYDETECGFRRSIAIILVGQNSNVDKGYNLQDKLGNWDLHEVSERCELMQLGGLGKELGDYLGFKFGRAGSKREIVKLAAVQLLRKAWDTPLAVNNTVALAMTLAFEVGKDVVTQELMGEGLAAVRGRPRD